MAMVPKYTSQASVPGGTGMQAIPLSLATSPLSGAGEGFTKVASALDAAATRIQNREDQETEKVYVSAFDKVFATDDLKAAEDFVNSGNFRKNVTDVQLRSAISSIQTEKKERNAAIRKAKV
jgi:hypothetical protein